MKSLRCKIFEELRDLKVCNSGQRGRKTYVSIKMPMSRKCLKNYFQKNVPGLVISDETEFSITPNMLAKIIGQDYVFVSELKTTTE